MSEQSPWGAPPPSAPGPYGPPQQGPYPGGPPGPPPGGGYPPPGSPYGGPPGPPYPPRKRTGLIVGLAVGAVVLVAAVVVGVVVATGGDDDQVADDPSSQSASPEPDETTSDSPSESTSETPSESPTSDAPPVDDDTVVGTGYQYQLPGEAWTDATDEAAALGPSIDSIVVLGASIDVAQSNILVEAGPSGGETDVDELAPAWKRNIQGDDDATLKSIDDITIDGERAVGLETVGRVNAAGLPITQVAYLTVHDGAQFSIALSYPTETDTVSTDDFQTVLDSWAWTS